MTNNRARGRRGELAAARRYGGSRISRTGEEGSDVLINGKEWEVKLIANMPMLLRKWMAQATKQGSQGVLFKSNRSRWYVLMEADNFFGEFDYVEVSDLPLEQFAPVPSKT